MADDFGGPLYQAVAGVCAWSALLVALYQIVSHLRHYTEPTYQRYIVRIVFMVPFYAVASFFSLVFADKSIYFDTVRDCYEAWVIYNFLALCLAYVGGPGRVEIAMSGYVLAPSVGHCTCCLPPMPVNGRFVRACKRGTLQFVLLKPVLAALTMVLHAKGKYLWVTLLYNATYSAALFFLLLFYMGTRDLLAPFKPVLKFVTVKSVVFATFWQGLAIAVAVAAGGLAGAGAGQNLQNLLICVEMLPASLAMLLAFPAKEYAREGGGGGGRVQLDTMRHAISIRDVVTDTVHQFAPAYHDYVLYAEENGGAASPTGAGGGSDPASPGAGAGRTPPLGAKGGRTVRTATFLAVGRETATRVGRPGGAPVGGGGAGGARRGGGGLLAGVEMGVHGAAGRPAVLSDGAPGPAPDLDADDGDVEAGDDAPGSGGASRRAAPPDDSGWREPGPAPGPQTAGGLVRELDDDLLARRSGSGGGGVGEAWGGRGGGGSGAGTAGAVGRGAGAGGAAALPPSPPRPPPVRTSLPPAGAGGGGGPGDRFGAAPRAPPAAPPLAPLAPAVPPAAAPLPPAASPAWRDVDL